MCIGAESKNKSSGIPPLLDNLYLYSPYQCDTLGTSVLTALEGVTLDHTVSVQREELHGLGQDQLPHGGGGGAVLPVAGQDLGHLAHDPVTHLFGVRVQIGSDRCKERPGVKSANLAHNETSAKSPNHVQGQISIMLSKVSKYLLSIKCCIKRKFLPSFSFALFH